MCRLHLGGRSVKQNCVAQYGHKNWLSSQMESKKVHGNESRMSQFNHLFLPCDLYPPLQASKLYLQVCEKAMLGKSYWLSYFHWKY